MSSTRSIEFPIGLRALACAALLFEIGSSAAAPMFEDTFDGGSLSPAWVSKLCCQSVQVGWLHTRGVDGGPRNSMAIVHDSDASWADYKVSVEAQFVDIGFVDSLWLLLRTDNYLHSSGPNTGLAYHLSINGPRGWGLPGEANHIVLSRANYSVFPWPHVTLGDVHMPVSTDPMLIEARLTGGHIQVWIDHVSIFDVTDPNPLPAGGVGVGAIWETEARYDNLRVTAVPELPAALLVVLGLTQLGVAVGRRRTRGAGFGMAG